MKNVERAHRIIIKSLHDAIAECECGGWYYCFTGKSTVGEIRREWLKHVEKSVIAGLEDETSNVAVV